MSFWVRMDTRPAMSGPDGPLSLPRRPPSRTPQGTQPASWGPTLGTCIGTQKPQLCVGDSLSRPPGGGARGSFPVAPQPTWGQTPQSRPETTGPPPPGSLTRAGEGKKRPSSLCSHMALPCVSVLISLSFLLKVTGFRVHRAIQDDLIPTPPICKSLIPSKVMCKQGHIHGLRG